MQIRLISSLCIAAIVLIFTGFLFESASSFTLYVILLGILLIPARGVRIELSLLYNIGILAVLFFYWYWGEFYGSHYFIGGFSDDWQYDVLWSEGYHRSYGINPFYLSEHLGILHNSKGYVYLVVLMREFGSTIDGYHTFLPRFLNIFFLGMTSLVSYNITLHFSENKRQAKIVMITVFLFPVMLFNSVHVFRDTLVGLLIMLYFYSMLKIPKFKVNLVWLISVLMVLATLRFSTFAILVMLIPMFFIPIKNLIWVGLLLAPVAIFVLISQFGDVFNEMLRLVNHYDTLNTERFGFLGTKIFALPKVIGFIPRVIYLIFTPVLNFSSFHQLYTSLTAILQIIFFPILFFGLLSKVIDTRLKIVFLILFIGVAMSSASFRHVVMYIPLGIIITCLYMDARGKLFNIKYFQQLAVLVFAFFSTLVLITVY